MAAMRPSRPFKHGAGFPESRRFLRWFGADCVILLASDKSGTRLATEVRMLRLREFR